MIYFLPLEGLFKHIITIPNTLFLHSVAIMQKEMEPRNPVNDVFFEVLDENILSIDQISGRYCAGTSSY